MVCFVKNGPKLSHREGEKCEIAFQTSIQQILVYKGNPNFIYFPLLPLAKFGYALLWKITKPPTSQI